MAIKSSDPRKLGERSMESDRFERIVADAWMSRHEDEPPKTRTSGRTSGGPTTQPAVHAADPTYQPFANLKELMGERH